MIVVGRPSVTARALGRFVSAALLLQTACGDAGLGGDRSATFAVRDSAGTQIVESREPLWRDTAQAWRVDPTPAVDIGVTYGRDELQLAEVQGAIRLADGRIVVGEFGVNIKFFDSTGRHITTLARRGQGPGEGDLLSGLLPYRGDSILMITDRSSAATVANVLDADGRPGRKIRIAAPSRSKAPTARFSYGAHVGLQGVLGDGSFVARSSDLMELRGSSGLLWGTAQLFHISADGAQIDTIATLRTSDVEEAPSEPASYLLPLFRRDAPQAAVHDRWLYWGDGDRFEISVFQMDRQESERPEPTRLVRVARPNPPAGATERDRYVARAIASARTEPGRAAMRAFYERHPSRPTLPAFRALRVDASGNLWVERFRITAPEIALPPDSSDKPQWTVFDARGVMLGDVFTPPRLQITSIGPDWILGIWTDEEGVQHVRLHRIVRP